jgi:hypothetical protein
LEERVLFVGGGHHLETMGGLKPSEVVKSFFVAIVKELSCKAEIGRLSLLHLRVDCGSCRVAFQNFIEPKF